MIVAMANMPFDDSWQMFEEEASGMILVFRLLEGDKPLRGLEYGK